MVKLEACMQSPNQPPQYSVQSHSFSIGKISKQFILKAYDKILDKTKYSFHSPPKKLQQSNIPASKQASN